MAMRDEDIGTALTLTEGDAAIWSPPMSSPASEPPDWQARAEMERARADAAEARAEELRWAEVAARGDAGAWKSQFKACRQRLSEAEKETRDLRRAAKDVPSLQAEVARLQELLSEARSGSSEFGTIEALRDEVARLHKALASKARKDSTGPLSRENARLRKALERLEGQKDEVAALRKSERAARTALSKESIRLGKALKRSQKQGDTIGALRGEVESLTREIRRQKWENGRLHRELEWLESLKATIRRMSGEARLLRGELAGYHDQTDVIKEKSREAFHLRMALIKSDIKKDELEAKLAERPLLPTAVKRLRKQEKTIEALQTRNEGLEEELAKLRSSRAVLSKALHGRKSEQQKKPGTGRKRGQQRGAPGHGRTPRPKLQEKIGSWTVHHPKRSTRARCGSRTPLARGSPTGRRRARSRTRTRCRRCGCRASGARWRAMWWTRWRAACRGRPGARR